MNKMVQDLRMERGAIKKTHSEGAGTGKSR